MIVIAMGAVESGRSAAIRDIGIDCEGVIGG
jgi:hypothetical protein